MAVTTDTFSGSLILLALLFIFWLPALVLWFVGVRSRAIGRPLRRSIRTSGLVVEHRTIPAGAAGTAEVAIVTYSAPDGRSHVLIEGRRRGGRLPEIGDEVEISHDRSDPSRAKSCSRGRLRRGWIAGVVSGLYLSVWAMIFWRVAVPFTVVVVAADVALRVTSGRGLGHRLAYRPLPEAARSAATASTQVAAPDQVRQAEWIGRARRVGARERNFGHTLLVMVGIGVLGLGREAGPLLPMGLVFLACGARAIEMALPPPFGLRAVEIKQRGSWGDPSTDPAYVVVVERRSDGSETTVHTAPVAGRTTPTGPAPTDLGYEVDLAAPPEGTVGSLWVGGALAALGGLIMAVIVSPTLAVVGLGVLGLDYARHFTDGETGGSLEPL